MSRIMSQRKVTEHNQGYGSRSSKFSPKGTSMSAPPVVHHSLTGDEETARIKKLYPKGIRNPRKRFVQ